MVQALHRVPVSHAFFGSMVVGLVAAVPVAHLLASQLEGDSPRDGAAPGIGRARAGLLTAMGGAVLVGGGLLGAMAFEHVQGPWARRFDVDAAERVTVRLLNRNLSWKSAMLGAVSAGLGVGLMTSGWSTGWSSM